MTEAAKTTKINGVYCVSNAIGGGMKNAERTKKERDALCGECVSEELKALVIQAGAKEEVIQDKRPITKIRFAVMNDLSAMSDAEFAEFAEDLSCGVDRGLFSNLQSKKELDEDNKCVSCKRIFGKCIIAEAHNFGCPFSFAEWALADGSMESDYELIKRFVTRIIKEKADE